MTGHEKIVLIRHLKRVQVLYISQAALNPAQKEKATTNLEEVTETLKMVEAMPTKD